ncbi:mRNA 3'-end-processing protein RNA14 [Cryptococcus neoformans var, neoformans JEC21] [Rhizoctonia solani]|uniref:mRNA 3'-end-processing protein RNA14 [Cryptococcus neoformans var, neoformans JEC21] n=1 Tax=Rhizoctonia solani TaxID=456999 RepID=A0A0K6GFZ0_9AGAM|nr:mRNA 3'-end-processing protein RNA14 [Cryptococcus neoformans var, neoformans JEC21] [Rhizoctonia solani]
MDSDPYLEDEIRGDIYYDPDFVKNFLVIEKTKRPLLEKELNKRNTRSTLDNSITAENELYSPILNHLRIIKEAVDTIRTRLNLGVLGTSFYDSHNVIIPGGGTDIRLLKPDLALFEDHSPNRRSWETLMVPIEVKAKHTYLKVGMKQLARYARAIFAHQMHRRHLYGVVICKWAATFVRFDRSGIVYSEPIDMLDDPKGFRQAFAGLMMLDRNAFGYDTAFTTEYMTGGKLEYYVDLPTLAFPSDNTERNPLPVTGLSGNSIPQSSTLQDAPARRFKVMECLCHRKSIRGCATTVLRLHEAQKRAVLPKSGEPPTGRMTRNRARLQQLQESESQWEEAPGGPDYVLKLMWREPENQQEGEVLTRLEGAYGVVQCQWYSDVLQWGVDCHEPGATSCDQCHDVTPTREVWRVKNLEDLCVQVAEEKEGSEPQHAEVEVDYRIGELHAHRTARIYTWTLFSTVGKPLQGAESLRQFLEAILDAMLGYWQVFNQGILHRDISEGNVLIANPGQGYKLRKWKLHQELVAHEGQQTAGAHDHPLTESRKLAHKTIAELGRDPIGFLSDFDLAKTHYKMECKAVGRVPARAKNTHPLMPDSKEKIDMEPPAKRPRLEADARLTYTSGPIVTQHGKQSKECAPSAVLRSREKSSKLMDFRTGTPPFMSVRVSRVREGVTYEHNFIDDLESFFWVILWCVVEHMDYGSDENGNENQRTEGALTILHQLDRVDSDLITMAYSKVRLLLSCTTSEDHPDYSITHDLQSCQNSWASNPVMIDVIRDLGAHFYKIVLERNSFSSYDPVTQFPTLIKIISQGLERL